MTETDKYPRFVIICVTIILFITGCKEKKNNNENSNNSKNPNKYGLVLDFEKAKEQQILKSELFLSYVEIKQFHIHEHKPTIYAAEAISKIIFYYQLFPHTKEWGSNKMDIHLKDGSIKSESCKKAWNVTLGVTNGRGHYPIIIEQHFIQN